LWARAPAPEIGLLVYAETKRRTTAGSGMHPTRRFAFSTHEGRRPKSMTRGPGPRARGWAAAFGGDKEARLFAPRAVVRLLCTRRPSRYPHDLWGWAPAS
jgi:hypothetical protein